MIDESCGEEAKKQQEATRRTGVRTAVMSSFNFNLGWLPKSPVDRASDLGIILRLMVNRVCPPSTKPRTIMDIQKLAEDWIVAVVQMSTAHNKDEYDAGDAQADKLLTPLLAAPIVQVREFYGVLLEKMKNNPQVPFLVWMAYEAWGECVVKNAPDEGIKRLKKKLAEDIAELVEGPVRDQIPQAIARALQWRDPETLKEVKEALEGGAKPKLVGRQSCLFLEMKGKRGKKVSVMV